MNLIKEGHIFDCERVIILASEDYCRASKNQNQGGRYGNFTMEGQMTEGFYILTSVALNNSDYIPPYYIADAAEDNQDRRSEVYNRICGVVAKATLAYYVNACVTKGGY